MTFRSTLACVAALAALAACSDAPTNVRHAGGTPRGIIVAPCADCDPTPPPPDTGTSGGTVSTPADTALSITMYGPGKVLKESTVTFSATVTGGSGSYYYYWTEQVCWDGPSDCRDGYEIAEGQGLSSISHVVRSDMYTDKIQVHVKDSTLPYARTGNAWKNVLAPLLWTMNGKQTSFACQGVSSWYPFVGSYTANGTTVARNYIRSGCDGSKIWQPEYPLGPIS